MVAGEQEMQGDIDGRECCIHIKLGLPNSTKSVGPSKFGDDLSIGQRSLLAVPTLGAIDLSSTHHKRDAGSRHCRDRKAVCP